MNKKLLVTMIGVALTVGAGAANAIESKLSGQVGRAVMRADDGVSSELHHVDAADKTRFRFTGTGELIPGVKAGVNFEAEFVSNGSSSVTNYQKSQPRDTTNPAATANAPASPDLDERHLAVYLDGGFGRVTLGQTAGAADGATETDLSGTGIFASMTIADWGGAMNFCTAADATTATAVGTGTNCSGPSVSGVINNLDLEGRYDVLRYDSPALGPVKLSLSTGNTRAGNGATEFALRFSSDLGGIGKIEGALGKSTEKLADTSGPGTKDDETTGASVAWLHGSGLNLALAISERDVDTNRKRKFNYLKAGYKMGQHAVSLEMGKGKDQAALNDEAEVMGLAYVYSPVKWAELFAGWRVYSLDRPGTTFSDIDVLAVGAYFKF